jgi:hypothetical protein
MNGFIIATIVLTVLFLVSVVGSDAFPLGGVCFIFAIVCGVIGGIKLHVDREHHTAVVEHIAKATFPQFKDIRAEEGGSYISFQLGSNSASITCTVSAKMMHGKLHLEASSPVQGETLPPSCEQAVLAAAKS